MRSPIQGWKNTQGILCVLWLSENSLFQSDNCVCSNNYDILKFCILKFTMIFSIEMKHLLIYYLTCTDIRSKTSVAFSLAVSIANDQGFSPYSKGSRFSSAKDGTISMGKLGQAWANISFLLGELLAKITLVLANLYRMGSNILV